jgi:hypothetical protein
MNYRLAYAIRFHPCEHLAEHPPLGNKLLELVAPEEDEYGPPFGSALVLGAYREGAGNALRANGSHT